MLQGYLDYFRRTLLWKIEGLDREAAARRLVPSQTTLLGIVKHCADVERWWFQMVMAGEKVQLLYSSDEDPDGDWRIEPDDTVKSIGRAYREACDAADRAVAGFTLDDVSRGRGYKRSLRWVYLHMIEETGRHCGHADILRELTDGSTGD
jgi:hypothetical protein